MDRFYYFDFYGNPNKKPYINRSVIGILYKNEMGVIFYLDPKSTHQFIPNSNSGLIYRLEFPDPLQDLYKIMGWDWFQNNCYVKKDIKGKYKVCILPD